MGNRSSSSGQVFGPFYTRHVILNEDSDTGSFDKGRKVVKNNNKLSISEAVELASHLKSYILNLIGEHISTEDFVTVRYSAIRESEAYKDYKVTTRKLHNLDLSCFNDVQKKAVCINLYNSMVVHALCEGLFSDTYGTFSRMAFFAGACYNIGGHIYSLNDMENGIMRCNRKSAMPFTSPPFGSSDDRRASLMSKCDPRIHFALNCGAQSCPPIQYYSSEEAELESQLKMATEGYLEGDIKVEGSVVSISMLFSWYRVDFGTSDKEIVSWISDHLPDGSAVKEDLVRLLSSSRNSSSSKNPFSIVYNEYNWNLNCAD